MTQHRDWQKDMEMCEAATHGPWIAKAWTVPKDDQYNITSEHDNSELFTAWQGTRYPGGLEVSGYQAMGNAVFAAEARTALPYWLREVKRLEGLATGRGQAIIRKNREISELEARADAAEEEMRYQKGVTEDYAKGYRLQELRAIAAEAREQRLKEEVEYEIEICTLRGSDERAKELKELLTTLYPDTPSPTRTED